MKKPLLICLLLAIGCSKPVGETADADSTEFNPIDSATSDPVLEYIDNAGIIEYWDVVDDSVEVALATFEPLNEVLTLATKAIRLRDSVEFAKNTWELTDPEDTAIFAAQFRNAYDAILAYTRIMKGMPRPTDPCPRLTDLERPPTGEKDKTKDYLPQVERSDYLIENDFFFMGAAPFIEKLEGEHEGPNGPELLFSIAVPDNANYMFNSVFNHLGGSINVSYGPALDSYESGPQSIYGIGSLKHDFVERVPVLFLTDEGVVPAELVSVVIRLLPESLGCISGQPRFTFACSAEALNVNNIMGIYIPYGHQPKTWIVRHINNSVWVADLDGDGVPELAAIEGTFSGGSGDDLAEVLWFANVDGKWKIIDAGRTVDCT